MEAKRPTLDVAKAAARSAVNAIGLEEATPGAGVEDATAAPEEIRAKQRGKKKRARKGPKKMPLEQ